MGKLSFNASLNSDVEKESNVPLRRSKRAKIAMDFGPEFFTYLIEDELGPTERL